MSYLIAILFGVAIFGAVWLIAQMTLQRTLTGRNVRQQLDILQGQSGQKRFREEQRRRSRVRSQIQDLIEKLGQSVGPGKPKPTKNTTARDLLTWAGFRQDGRVALYVGLRVLGGLLGVGLGGLLARSFGLAGWEGGLLILWLTLLGWMLPFLYVNRRRKNRQTAIKRSIPDMLDLLVVSMEAGLGFNQALLRVADKIQPLSPQLSEEMALTLLQLQTGQDRREALRGLYQRTGVEELDSLASLLIHTDRYGTSIGKALRAHSQTVRRARRQAAQERAAKVSVKMLLPLIFLVLPTLFVVILGPAFFHIADLMVGM